MKFNNENTYEYDVVVVGGGAAGVAAAVSASRQSLKVALIERYGFLGGAGTISSVQAFCGFFDQNQGRVVHGIGGEVLNRLDLQGALNITTSKNSGNTLAIFQKETLKTTLDTLCAEAGVDVFLHTTVFSVHVEAKRITRISATHRSGSAHFIAPQFIDTSGDGALIQRSSKEALLTPPEERQASTLVMSIAGLKPDADPAPATLSQAIQHTFGDEEKVGSNVAVRIGKQGQAMLLMVDEHFDTLDVLETSAAERRARLRASQYFSALNALPGWEIAYLANTGPQIGIRESVRLKGKDLVTEFYISEARKLHDTGIARCGWPMEDHSIPGKTDYISIQDKGWFHIPLGALESDEIHNLWAAGRLTSSDRKAFTSIRVMGTAFATGHAAGIAASQRILLNTEHSHIREIRKTLSAQGALI